MPEALALIQARAAMVLSEEPPFNELLTVAYMEKQSMGFHTDGEQGLGPVVASLSMGSPAIMKFRTMEGKTVVLTLVLRHVCDSVLVCFVRQFTRILRARGSKSQSFSP